MALPAFQANARFLARRGNALGGGLSTRVNKLVSEEKRISVAAARTATRVTGDSFVYRRNRNVQARPGRRAGGTMRQALGWVPSPGTSGVVFDVKRADREFPAWIIQEIGTGHRATLKQGGADKQGFKAANPVGRPAAGATYVRTVRSQRGRAIPFSLVFATGPGGTYVPAGAGTGQQLFLRSMVRGAPQGTAHGRRALRITREIHGQHMVKQGGRAGFRQYRPAVLAAARSAFAGQGKP